jgi:hypothetical protein
MSHVYEYILVLKRTVCFGMIFVKEQSIWYISITAYILRGVSTNKKCYMFYGHANLHITYISISLYTWTYLINIILW